MIKKDNDQKKLTSIKETVSGLQKTEDLSAIEKKVQEETDDCQLKTEQLMSPLLQNDYNQENIHQQISQLGQLMAPLQGAANSLGIQQIAAAQAIGPLVSSLASINSVIKPVSGVETVASVIAPAVRAMSEATTTDISGIMGAANALAVTTKQYENLAVINSGLIEVLNSAVKTPELLRLQKQIMHQEPIINTLGKFVSDLSFLWQESKGMTDIADRSMAAQNIAFLRLAPKYRDLKLPRGGKKVLKELSKPAAEKLTQMDEILFDPEKAEFYHKDTPKQTVTSGEITVAESSLDLFEGITLDELISFESQLFEDSFFALKHPIGEKIYEIIRGWTEFIGFESDTYYHARTLGKNKKPLLDQEMLKAPVNVSSHGRYNEIGKSCYYVTDTLEGAVSEIKKHSGGTKPTIQVVTITPIKAIKLIDLSKEVSRRNNFIEHLRYTVDNEDGKIIKEYLLPNFVASCCKHFGIEGIKYLSTGYCCYVMWKDDYFKFVDGGRKIIEPE